MNGKDEITRHNSDTLKNSMTNLEFTNSGRYKGDNDGPAYVVYSKIGYNKASFEFKMSEIKLNMRRKSNQRWTNSYIFLGVDVYDEKEEFLNCIDAGFCYSGDVLNWHLFYNLLNTSQKVSWYESPVALEETHDYRLILDCSGKDTGAILTIIDITEKEKIVDTAEFEVMYAKKDGSNLSMYQDYAIDFPDDIKKNLKGEDSADDWEEITLYNTDEDIYLNNIVIQDAKLYSPEGEYLWTKERTNDRFMWPHTKYKKIDYACTRIREQKLDSELVLDLDMNHR